MFSNENTNMYGHEEKKERKKIVKMKDMFEIPQGTMEKIEKKEATIIKKLDKDKKDKVVKNTTDTRLGELKKGIHITMPAKKTVKFKA